MTLDDMLRTVADLYQRGDATPVNPNEPYRQMRPMRSPARAQEPMPEGPPPTAAGLATSFADPLGIPSWAVGQVSPEARDAWRGQYENDTSGSLMGGMAFPFGTAAKGIGAAVSAGVKAVPTAVKAGGAGIAGTLWPEEAESQRLLPEQRRQVELERQKAAAKSKQTNADADAAAARDSTSRQEEHRLAQEAATTEAERKKQESAGALNLKLKEADEGRQRDIQARSDLANMPFRERFPELNKYLPMAPVAAGIGLALRGRMGSNALAKEWGATADKAQDAMVTGRAADAAQLGRELEGFSRTQSVPAQLQQGAGRAAAGAALSTEAALAPYHYDALALPEGNPEKAFARGISTSAPESFSRAMMPALAGGTLAVTGGKILPWPERRMPIEKTAGIQSGLATPASTPGAPMGAVEQALPNLVPSVSPNMLKEVVGNSPIAAKLGETAAKTTRRRPKKTEN